MKNITKAIAGTVAAGAMAMTSAAPAHAGNNRDRVDAGDIIAGALILGGIAAVVSASGNKRGYNDRNYRDRDYRSNNNYRQSNPRAAVERCISTAERRAKRSGYRFADVTQIRDVDRTRYGFRVQGRIVVDGARGYRGANNGHRYNDRTRYDERGYNYRNNSRADRGKFTCLVEQGGRPQVNFRGIRGL